MRYDTHSRRDVLRRTATGLGLLGFAGSVQARGRGSGEGNQNTARIPLVDGPAEFKVFVGMNGDPDTPSDFDYPGTPTVAGEDPVGGLFDAADIEKTPTGQTLHHVFRLLQGFLIRDGRGKPYVLNHEGDGRFTERGQTLNFEARNSEELKGALAEADLNPAIADREPFATLAGGTWRAVGNDVVQMLGDPAESRRLRWAVTRVDFYRRSGGPLTFELSALYVLYPNLDEDGTPVPAEPRNPTIRPIPPEPNGASRQLITDGRANPGGQ